MTCSRKTLSAPMTSDERSTGGAWLRIDLPDLRLAADDRERMHDVVLADHRVTGDDDVPEQARALVDANARSDEAVRTDLDVVRELGARIDDGGRVDAMALTRARVRLLTAQPPRSTTLASSSPCAQSVPSTLASPFSFHTLVRWCTTVTSRSRRSPGTTGRRNFALSMPRK